MDKAFSTLRALYSDKGDGEHAHTTEARKKSAKSDSLAPAKITLGGKAWRS